MGLGRNVGESRGAPARPSRRTSWPAAASARPRAPRGRRSSRRTPPLVSRPGARLVREAHELREPAHHRALEVDVGVVARRRRSGSSPRPRATRGRRPSDGGGLIQPKNAGWPFPIGYGRTSRSAVATSSSSVAGSSGSGRPSSCSRRSSGSGCQTGPDGSAARWSTTPSTSACAAARNAAALPRAVRPAPPRSRRKHKKPAGLRLGRPPPRRPPGCSLVGPHCSSEFLARHRGALQPRRDLLHRDVAGEVRRAVLGLDVAAEGREAAVVGRAQPLDRDVLRRGQGARRASARPSRPRGRAG